MVSVEVAQASVLFIFSRANPAHPSIWEYGRADRACSQRMASVSRLRFVLLAAVSLAVTGCGAAPEGGSAPSAAPTAPSAPELRPITPERVSDALAAFRGKVVLVNAWATWCLPCKEEFPDLLRVHRELHERGLELLLISADFEAQREAARRFLAQQGVDFPSYHKVGNDEAFINAIDPSWSGALPATLVLGRDGKKAAFWEGTATYERFKQTVEALL